MRLKVLEDGLRMSSSGVHRTSADGRSVSNGPSRRQSLGGGDNISKASPNGLLTRRTSSFQFRSSLSSGSSMVLKHAKGTSKSFDGGSRSYDRNKVLANGVTFSLNKSIDETRDGDAHSNWKDSLEKPIELRTEDADDSVSGLLYDMLQKEVITLRKACYEKDQSLKDKDDAIEVKYIANELITIDLYIPRQFESGVLPVDAGKESGYINKGNGSGGQENEKRGGCHGEGGCFLASR